jgi:putative NAD(P)H nitroreductase
MNINLNQFTEIVRSRRSTRHFLSKAVPTELLHELLETTRWSPSAFNLQPTHFVVVTDQSIKEKLYPACMNQRQVLEAGAVVVFTGDRHVVEHNFERVLQQDHDAHANSEEYEQLLRKNVPLSFNRGFLGLGWLWKAMAEIIVGRFIPIPKLQAVHRDYWLAKQVAIAAQTFMLAAEIAGLATCPMEGFSERAVQEALNIPSDQAVILVIPVGYADNSKQTKTRLSLSDVVHQNGW